MKKTNFITLMAAAVLFVLAACKPTEDPLAHLTDGVTVTTADPTYITGSTATCGAEVTVDDAGLLIELGVCWSKSEKPTVDDKVMKTHKCSQPYICLLTNLEPNTTYHVRGYAKYGTEYCYGEEKTFTTMAADVPATSPITTLEAYNITAYSFCASASLQPFGGTSYYVGMCYSTQPEFTIVDCEGCEFYYDCVDNVYQIYCDGLTPNTQYYYRAFVAYNGENNLLNNYFYGDILSFTTPDIPFELEVYTYNAYYYWYDNTIEAYGEVNTNKPNLIDQVGFCYSDTNEYPQYESDLHITAGTPTGNWYDFYGYIPNLSANTKYYIRAFARYSTDSIRYGNVVSVDTYKKD